MQHRDDARQTNKSKRACRERVCNGRVSTISGECTSAPAQTIQPNLKSNPIRTPAPPNRQPPMRRALVRATVAVASAAADSSTGGRLLRCIRSSPPAAVSSATASSATQATPITTRRQHACLVGARWTPCRSISSSPVRALPAAAAAAPSGGKKDGGGRSVQGCVCSCVRACV